MIQKWLKVSLFSFKSWFFVEDAFKVALPREAYWSLSSSLRNSLGVHIDGAMLLLLITWLILSQTKHLLELFWWEDIGITTELDATLPMTMPDAKTCRWILQGLYWSVWIMLVAIGIVLRAQYLTTVRRRVASCHIPLESVPAHLVFEVWWH